MSRKEAIKMLKSKMDGHTDTSYEWAETVRMAIKALEQEPSISEDGTLTINVEDGNKVNRVLVCGSNHFGGLYYPEYEPCENPHIYECSCGYGWDRRTMWRDHFCPNCGREVQEVK